MNTFPLVKKLLHKSEGPERARMTTPAAIAGYLPLPNSVDMKSAAAYFIIIIIIYSFWPLI